MRVYKEEIFGPVMPVLAFDDGDDIAAMANDTEYGLAAYLFTNDLNEAFSISRAIDAGSVSVNAPFYACNLPHGGLKESGIGKDCSKFSLEEYYGIQRISIQNA
ncbi:putative aldehyde dehydrogenase [bioreactor metagenome]|uniref:Putative aldehyde dehydrogenase n=1 Tax=bioreactor metagenome TaxID=1076179 RepID=A0A645GPE0_9ZZZZ